MSEDAALARVQMFLGAERYDEAARELASYLARVPDDGRALCLAAQTHLGLGNPRLALESASRAAVLRPGDDWPQRLMSNAHTRMNQSRESLAAAERGVALNPNNWMTHYQVAHSRYLGQRLTDAAITSIDEAARLAPNEATVHRLAGQIHSRLEHRKLAEKAFRRALAINPEDAVARHELARISLQRRRLGSAVDGFSNAAALDPRISAAVLNIDLVLGRATRPYFYMIVAANLVQPSVRPRFAVPLVLSLSLVVVTGILLHRVGRRLNRYFRMLPSREPALAALIGLVVGAILALWVGAFIPAVQPVSIVLCWGARYAWRRWRIARADAIQRLNTT